MLNTPYSMLHLSTRCYEIYSRYVDQILLDVSEDMHISKEPSVKEGLLLLERNEYRYHLEEFLKTVVNFLYFRDVEYLQKYLRWRYRYYSAHKIESRFLYSENKLIQKVAQHYTKTSFSTEVAKLHGYIADIYDSLSSDSSMQSATLFSEEVQKVYELLLQGDRAAFESEIAQNTPTLQAFCSYFTHTLSGVLLCIGEQWELGLITVAQEHRMSAIIKDVALARLESYESKEHKAQKFFLSSVVGEEHTLGLEISAKILQHLGYEVVILGSKFSEQEMLNALYEFRASHFLFTITLPTNLINVARSIEHIRTEPLPLHPKCYVAGGAISALSDPFASLGCDEIFETFIDFYERFA